MLVVSHFIRFGCGALRTEVLLGTSLIHYASAEEVMLGFRLSTYLFVLHIFSNAQLSILVDLHEYDTGLEIKGLSVFHYVYFLYV